MIFDPYTTNSFSARTQIKLKFDPPHEKQASIPTLKPNQFRSRKQKTSAFLSHSKTKLNSIQTPKQSKFRSLHYTKGTVDAPKQRSSQFLSPHQNQVVFDTHAKAKSVPIPALKASQFGPPTQKSYEFRPSTQRQSHHTGQYTKIKLMSTPTLMSSQFRSPL